MHCQKRLFRLVKYLTWAQDMDRLALVLPKLTIEKLTWLTLMNELWQLAKQNAQKNGVENLTRIFQSDVYQNIDQQYAAILVNPPIRAGKQVVTAMLQEAIKYLQPGGKLIAVLQKKQGAPSAQKNMLLAFGNASVIHKNKGYYILESTYGESSDI